MNSGKGADYCIVRGRLFRHTGCQWEPAALSRAKYKPTNKDIPMYLYVHTDSAFLLRRRDSFEKRRGDARALIDEGPLETVWPTFIAHGQMQETT